MRSDKRRDLDGVLRQFEAWRAGGRRRRIPDRLWGAAVGLLDRYRASTICRRLVLNPSRFKQLREVLVGDIGHAGERGRRKAVPQAHLMPRGRTSRKRGADSTRQAFVELAPFGSSVLPALASPLPPDGCRTATECRLVVESSGGVRLTVILRCADVSVIDAVCRSVLGERHVYAPTST